MIKVADFLNSIAQLYITFYFICNLWKSKYNFAISNLIVVGSIVVTYIKATYILVNASVFIKMISGLVGMIVFAIIILDGTIIQNIIRGAFYYAILGALEAICIAVICNWLSLDYHNVDFTGNLVLGRVFFTLSAYLFILILGFLVNRKRSKELRQVMLFFIILAACEIIFFITLVYIMWENGDKYVMIISGFYTVLIMIGYHITTEMFYEMIRQQDKKNEMEQRLLEKQYQYDYYILAKNQAEQVRDLRHDMRNQLQTVQYLMCSEMEDEKKHAREMLENLEERVMGLMMEDEL